MPQTLRLLVDFHSLLRDSVALQVKLVHSSIAYLDWGAVQFYTHQPSILDSCVGQLITYNVIRERQLRCYMFETRCSDRDIQIVRTVALLLASLIGITYAVHTVEVHGQDFVHTVTNKRLMIIGVE